VDLKFKLSENPPEKSFDKPVFYFLFSRQSQPANNAVTIQATALVHTGISTALAVTFHWNMSLNKCTTETSSKKIVTTIIEGFIIALLFFKKL
jgi:hypothetical protein